MDSKKIIMLFMFIGSTIGGFLPMLWGGGALSMSSVITTAIGGFAGIYIGYKLTN